MTSYSYQLTRVLPALSSAMGLLALSGGIYGLTNPSAFRETLGIHSAPASALTRDKISSSALASSAENSIASFVAARNLGMGVSLLTLLYLGEKRAVGITMMCGVATAVADAWICFEHDGTEGKAVGHAVMGVLSGGLGAGLYWL